MFLYKTHNKLSVFMLVLFMKMLNCFHLLDSLINYECKDILEAHYYNVDPLDTIVSILFMFKWSKVIIRVRMLVMDIDFCFNNKRIA